MEREEKIGAGCGILLFLVMTAIELGLIVLIVAALWKYVFG